MSEAVPMKRQRNMPSIDILKPQGENRFIAKVHENAEHKTAGGLIIAETTQDYPTTGDVLFVTERFDKVLFPDIQPGMCVKVTMHGWSQFKVDGVMYAIGDARNVIAAYDPKQVCQEQ